MLKLITHSKIAGADEQRLQHLPHDILLDTGLGDQEFCFYKCNKNKILLR
jgi:hypothetical protein